MKRKFSHPSLKREAHAGEAVIQDAFAGGLPALPDNVVKLPSALKHGVYSAMSVIPGEDANECDKFVRAVVDEFDPQGPTEEDIVYDIARLLWRKAHLTNYYRTQFNRLKSQGYYCEKENPKTLDNFAPVTQVLFSELSVIERIDTMINRKLKQFLLVRGAKEATARRFHVLDE
jgi:hypothetical protein